MKDLIKWARRKLKDKDLHPLLITSIFVVHFLAIHPFQDGNGRLSRILTTLLLLKNGYAYVPYSSLENVIERNKENYYLALRRSQSTLYTDDSELETWILFFLRSLKAQKDMLSKKIELEHKVLKLPELSMQIMEIVKEHGQTSISQIHDITNANRNTIKVRLRELVENNYLIKEGKGKATRYIIGKNKV
jgi:Fic family protein